MLTQINLSLLLLLSGCTVTRTTVAEGTNSHFRHTLEVSAPPEAVWRLWTTVDTWPQWDTELEVATLAGAFGAGAKGVLKGKGAPEAAFEISGFEPPTAYQFTTGLPLGGTLIIDRRLEPTASGTRFTHDVRFEGFGGWLFAPFFGPKYREALPVVMRRIAELAEGAP